MGLGADWGLALVAMVVWAHFRRLLRLLARRSALPSAAPEHRPLLVPPHQRLAVVVVVVVIHCRHPPPPDSTAEGGGQVLAFQQRLVSVVALFMGPRRRRPTRSATLRSAACPRLRPRCGAHYPLPLRAPSLPHPPRFLFRLATLTT